MSDLCLGLGTGLSSFLAMERQYVAMEIDERQSSILKRRILNLVDNTEEDVGKRLVDSDDEIKKDIQWTGPKTYVLARMKPLDLTP